MGNGLDGITVDGKHIVEYIQKKIQDDKSKEIEVERVSVERNRGGKHKTILRYESDDKPRVSKRVRRLTDREIRREYGIMAKPYATKAENVIWAILENGPLSVVEIEKMIDWKDKRNSLSALCTMIWHSLGDKGADVITRIKGGDGAFVYEKKKGVQISVEAAVEKYRIGTRKLFQGKKEKEQKPDRQAEVDDTKQTIMDIAQQKLSQALGVDVNVNVDVVFRFGK